jgi:DNA-binding transcriptional regulator YiaG
MRRRLGLTQAQFAALLGVTRVTVARWEVGTVAVPEPMAKLIRMVVESQPPRKEK